MSEVINLKERREKQPLTTTMATAFEKAKETFEAKKRRMAEERKRQNAKVKRSYRLKGK